MTAIHRQLEADCIYLGRFPLCHLLLMNDRNYPWFILVPDRDKVREIYQLNRDDRAQLLDESCQLSGFLMDAYAGEKLNLAALGNQVPQLHLHHIVRYATDPAWPGPVWGKFPAQHYDETAISAIKSKFVHAGLEGFEVAARR